MRKKAKKPSSDPQAFGYSIVKRMASRKKRVLSLTLIQYTILKNLGCSVCSKKLPDKTMGVELIDKKGPFDRSNLRGICGVCKATNVALEFDYIKYSINQLRRGWKKTPYALLAIQLAKNDQGQIKCIECDKYYPPKKINLDHINAAISPILGFTSLDDFAKRLLCINTGLQTLCLEHHKNKTRVESAIRKAHGSIKKGKEIKRKMNSN